MKSVEMYRLSQYKDWAQAFEMGGVYRLDVPMDVLDSVIHGLVATVRDCMDGADRLVWRVVPVRQG